MRAALVFFPCCVAVLMAASLAAGEQRSFVSCPIVRDTRTVPCYLAEYDGETYYLGVQQDNAGDQSPQLKHEVLVEGTVVPGPRVCGGIPLQPVSISVMKEVDLACNTLLPAEPGIDAPAASRSSTRSEPAAPHQQATGKREFTVLYSFDYDVLDDAGERIVTEAAEYAKQTGARTVKVAGYRATSVLSKGQRLTEKAGLAENRAQNVATVLRGLGVTAVTAEWKSEAESGNGQIDTSQRRVTILVTP